MDDYTETVFQAQQGNFKSELKKVIIGYTRTKQDQAKQNPNMEVGSRHEL